MTNVDTAIVTTAKSAMKSRRKMARTPNTAENATETPIEAIHAKRSSKSDLVLDLLKRPEGATIDQIVAATGWLPHTTRAALTGLKKKGHVITSEKVEGVRRYRVSAGAA